MLADEVLDKYLFYQELSGVYFYNDKGKYIAKWELWISGYRDTEELLNGKTKFRCLALLNKDS